MVILLILGGASSSFAQNPLQELKAGAKAFPLESTEETNFLPRNAPIVGLTKADLFMGVLVRRETRFRSLTHLDVYDMSSMGGPVIDVGSCLQAIVSLFGPVRKPMDISSTEMFPVRNGQACEQSVLDGDPQAFFPERRVIAVVVENMPIALVARFPKKPTASELEELRSFVRSLRMKK